MSGDGGRIAIFSVDLRGFIFGCLFRNNHLIMVIYPGLYDFGNWSGTWILAIVRAFGFAGRGSSRNEHAAGSTAIFLAFS